MGAPTTTAGHKAWVRWDESGKDDIVPGSQVVRAASEPQTGHWPGPLRA